MTEAPAVELRGIAKRFPGVVANDDIDLVVRAGEVHAIVGENGAGKSTLMKILYGMQPPDEGTILVDGAEVRFRSPKDAIAVGIGMVHQHFMLADNLTVLENVVLGSEPRKGLLLDHSGARARIRGLADRYGMAIDPDALVEHLGVGERQRVEILKVLFRGARKLILDEPTAVLVPDEVDDLFASLAELKAQGVTVIFISHKLDEVLEIADTITVIRAGRTIGTADPKAITAREAAAEMMVGSELPKAETRGSTVTDVVELELDHVSLVVAGRPVVDNVSLRVRRGEVVGIAGVEGNGQTELVDVILGLARPAGWSDPSGWTRHHGHDDADRRDHGVGYIPADRHRHGLLLPAPLWENAMLGHQDVAPFSSSIWVNRQGARTRTQEIVRDFDVRAPGVDVAAHALSGGNQQKLIVGREMAAAQLLIAGHPTRGIDVGAQAAVWGELREARQAGLAVLLVSADLEELIGLSDTLLVMLRGAIVAQLDPQTLTPQELGSYMTGAAA